MSQPKKRPGALTPRAADQTEEAPSKSLNVTHCNSRPRQPGQFSGVADVPEKPRSVVWAERRAAHGLDDDEDRATLALGRVLAQSEPLLAQAPSTHREDFRRELSRAFTAGQAEDVLRRLRLELGRAS